MLSTYPMNPRLKPSKSSLIGFAVSSEAELQRKPSLTQYIYIFQHQITTGAYDDLKKAYQIAHSIVTKLGMAEGVGNIGFIEGEFDRSYSDETAKVI